MSSKKEYSWTIVVYFSTRSIVWVWDLNNDSDYILYHENAALWMAFLENAAAALLSLGYGADIFVYISNGDQGKSLL